MSPARRSKTPVLSQEDGLLWVEGIGVDESAAARPGQTRQVLQIEILESSCAGPPGPAAGAD